MWYCPWGIFLRQQKRLDDLLYAEIQERRDNLDESREDILSLMMAARGHETTASSLTWFDNRISPQIEIWGYTNKACLRRLRLFS